MIKRNVLIILVILLAFSFLVAQVTRPDRPIEDNDEYIKVEVTYSVTYNAITLEKAAQLEKHFRNGYKDACKVDVKIEIIEKNERFNYIRGNTLIDD